MACTCMQGLMNCIHFGKRVTHGYLGGRDTLQPIQGLHPPDVSDVVKQATVYARFWHRIWHLQICSYAEMG